MRVLFVSHDFLPNHPSGTEIYTAQLSRRLIERGVDVELFTTEKDITREHLSMRRREWDGMPVNELVNNLFYESFRETWDWEPAEEAFARVLDRVRPDVVHVMHLLYLSIGCVEEAARREIPVVYTLHDFWLQCARFGQRIHADQSICHTIDFERCGTCLAQLKFAQSKTERRTARALAKIKGATGVDLEKSARRVAGLLPTREPAFASPDAFDGAAARMAELAREREGELLRRLVPRVQRFFAPSAFLRERFVEWGIPAANITHVPNGIELEAYESGPPASARAGRERQGEHDGGALRVAFLGTLAPHKAPHLLLEAWEGLTEDQRARGRLTLFGPKQHFPAYVEDLERRARRVGARLPGPVARDEIPALWPEIDLLVIPSIWYENAPLTILEARATRTPVLVTDLGGMAEMVANGDTGWRFQAGAAAELSERIAGLLEDPRQLHDLTFESAAVKSMEVCADEMLAAYRDVSGVEG